MSLRTQLLSVLSALFLAILAAILIVSVSDTRQYLEQQLASHAQDAATALSVTLGQSLGQGDTVLAQAQVVSVFDRGYFKSIKVLAPDRSPLVQRQLPEKIQGVPTWFVRFFPIITPAGEAFVGSGWRQLGKVLVVSQPTYAYQHLWRTSAHQLGWLLAIFTMAIAVFMALLHLILKPLRAIEKTAMEVQAKRFVQIIFRPRAPELARVVAAMNQMSHRVGVMLDTESTKVRALFKQAYQDELTGLTNRRGYELRLKELLQGEHNFVLGAVVALEIDDMRLLNRMHGFAAVEQILRTVADTAREVFSEVPLAILARSNEFSFGFVLADLTHQQAGQLAGELRDRLMVQLEAEPSIAMVCVNIGTAFFTQQDSGSDVFARADLAVESARQLERNGFVVMGRESEQSSTLGSAGWRAFIQTALLEKRWRLLRQPVLSLSVPGQVLQGECMARLVDAQGALVPASHFMPMALRHRLMPEIDRAMLTMALDYMSDSSQSQETVAVNLSPQSMIDADFMHWLATSLKALPGGASRLAIEVSEFSALRHPLAALGVRDLVRRHGGKFGLDHFGQDPLALSLLRESLPDYVKLSGALMEEVETVELVNAMLQSLVALAHSLDVMVIAQKVEREGQIALLVAAQVDAAQGYYFGAPQ
jgi:diguanylate cyclase (GGDEF)-like protein